MALQYYYLIQEMAFYGILAEDFGLQSISEFEIHQFDWKSELHRALVFLLPGWLSNLIIFQGSATLQEHTEAYQVREWQPGAWSIISSVGVIFLTTVRTPL